MHAALEHGEWSHRNANDDRLNMIPDRSTLSRINAEVTSAECNFPDCVTRSGLPPGSVLYPGEICTTPCYPASHSLSSSPHHARALHHATFGSCTCTQCGSSQIFSLSNVPPAVRTLYARECCTQHVM